MDFVAFACDDDPEVYQWQVGINQAAIKADVPPCFLAAIVNRESGGRNIYQVVMTHGPGCGVGLTQITYGVDWTYPSDPTLNGYHLLRPYENLFVAANFFIAPAIAECKQAQIYKPYEYGVSCNGQVLYGAAVVYNAGWSAVDEAMRGGYDADKNTTNGYAEDVYKTYLRYVQASHYKLGS